VVLPWVEDSQPFEALSTALARFPVLPTSPPPLAGKQIPWPAEPLYAFDR